MKIKNLIFLSLAVLMCVASLSGCLAVDKTGMVNSIPEKIEPEESSQPEKEVEVMPEYWGFNDYEDFENPGAPEEITSYPTKVTKINDTKYQMECDTEQGHMTITLERRPWGMFNLWSWNFLEKNGKRHPISLGATDFEYVLRTVTPKGTTVFSGGNHGDEAFVSIDFYNGETGEKLELKNGKPVIVNKLHVIENSKLLWLPDDNGDSIADYDGVIIKDYTDDDVYCEVVRKYTFTGPQVKLNVDFNYVKDTKHSYSYYAMLPIDKKYGLWCDMIDRDGNLIKTIETLKVGKADYSGTQHSGNAATRVVLYGHVDPRFQLDMRVNTPTDSLGNSQNEFKTSIWDMNTTYNKVYFSKYPMYSTETVSSGTQLHTETVWLFKYVEDAQVPND